MARPLTDSVIGSSSKRSIGLLDSFQASRPSVTASMVRMPPNPPTPTKGAKRVGVCRRMPASVANKVYVIAPTNNGDWQGWTQWFDEHQCTYQSTFHDWCSLGIRDKGTGKPLNHRTRITTTDHSMSAHGCQRSRPRHISILTQEENAEDRARYEDYQAYIGKYINAICDIFTQPPIPGG